MRPHLAWLMLLSFAGAVTAQKKKDDTPRALDERLEVVCFAKNPDIVHPVALAVDRKGRVLCIESHTHFRPKDYKGPPTDRVRMFEDTNGDGKADRITTFFEGTRATMDIAIHPNGDVYLATRNEIWRLRDTKGAGVADEKERIIFLDTKGDYPHNGLSGLAFDLDGQLYFGLGENLGASYQLKGTDSAVLSGEGEGGNIYWCTTEGKKLRRVATGFWNPFGIHVDSFGRVFAIDNDPDSMPPCRLLHIVEGGDYGYQYRYGRGRRQPFHAWNGELPGTLPMLAGTGEGPCEIIGYESDGLPAEHYGKLLVTAWADHRIEQYDPQPKGATYTSERKIFLQGGKDFRPVGLAVAPDGSLFVSDWVLADYNLHNRGAIWHVRPKKRQKGKVEAPVVSKDRLTREAAAVELAKDEAGRAELRKLLTHSDPYVRASVLTALLKSTGDKLDLPAFYKNEPFEPLRAYAVRSMPASQAPYFRWVIDPALARAEAVRSMREVEHASELLVITRNEDPFLSHAARQRIASSPEILDALNIESLKPEERLQVLLAQRASGISKYAAGLAHFLNDTNEDVRFLAVKWVADQKLQEFRTQIEAGLRDMKLSVRMYQAYATALARLDNRNVNDAALADRFIDSLGDPEVPAEQKVQLLRLMPPNHPKLKLKLLQSLLSSNNLDLQREVVRTLWESSDAGRSQLLRPLTSDGQVNEELIADAVVGLTDKYRDDLLSLIAYDRRPRVQQEALRGLVGTDVGLDAGHRILLDRLKDTHPQQSDAVARLLRQKFAGPRPQADDAPGWLAKFGTNGDVDSGRRVFFHPKLAGCYRCHMVDGRGSPYGPDLSMLGRTEPRRIVESLVQPHATIAPSYQAWTLVTHEGKTLTGMLVHTNYDEVTYLDVEGKTFKLKTGDIAESKPSPKSIMPEGLVDQLTDQEVRDLLAYLVSRK